ncbi:hypothetical protein Dsin_000980 [Dipteronia sinensis]|uniref:RNase H type-1 domain-containing protein n=1 Tax=Dipteronia sinensis TaxID=43782 RepID=A0AAE0B4P1_9ROSI|nr:hypothetical protein Dsin_000980 [Dipteronia sinensis]
MVVLESLDQLYELAGYKLLHNFVSDGLVKRLGPSLPYEELGKAWVSMFFAVVWTAWKAMNVKVFNNEEASSTKVMDMVKFRVVWWFKNYGNGSCDPITLILLDIVECCTEHSKVNILKIGDCIPSPPKVLKFNVDGSASGSPGQASIGGVLLDNSGNVLCFFSINIGWQDAITTKILAIAKA